jgi:hypothetical protein
MWSCRISLAAVAQCQLSLAVGLFSNCLVKTQLHADTDRHSRAAAFSQGQ